MKEELNILIIDDYPIIIEAYIKILLSYKKYILNIDASYCYEQAEIAVNSNTYDVVFIDLQLISLENRINKSGEKLALMIRNKLPMTKIILTVPCNKPRVQSVIKSTPHNGLLIKKDITSELIINALETILNNAPFYSETVKKITAKSILQDVLLDELDTKIIYNLSIGVRTKNLVQHIPLSLSAIEKRKNNIKILFNVKSDEQLFEKAREQGFI